MIIMSIERGKHAGRYEFVRRGCATGSKICPNGEHAFTAYRLDRRGNHMPGGTVCRDITLVTGEETIP